jgi:hypothetical protein
MDPVELILLGKMQVRYCICALLVYKNEFYETIMDRRNRVRPGKYSR